MLISAVLVLIMTCVSIAASYFNTIQSVRLSIANQSMKAASFVASQLDTRAYQAFLENPVKENPAFKQLEKELAKAREQFGALFLYISKIDADLQGGRVMIASLPPDSDYTMQIGEPCYINAEQIHLILFHTKWEQAKSRNIVMQFAECPDPFDQIPSIDLIKWMSNLIDNALDAAASVQGEKWIRVSCQGPKYCESKWTSCLTLGIRRSTPSEEGRVGRGFVLFRQW